jgi:hypothetical protein
VKENGQPEHEKIWTWDDSAFTSERDERREINITRCMIIIVPDNLT